MRGLHQAAPTPPLQLGEVARELGALSLQSLGALVFLAGTEGR